MTLSEAIRQWLRDNPGWHFMGDVYAGLNTEVGKDKVIKTVSQMARRGQIASAGKHGTMRYTFGRPARKYTKQESSNGKRP